MHRLLLLLFASLLLGCNEASPPEQKARDLNWPNVVHTEIYTGAHLRLCGGGDFTKEAASMTIKYVIDYDKYEYFAFFPVVPTEVIDSVKACSEFKDAYQYLHTYDGSILLARKMSDGSVSWEN